jgi:hypothetical protein
VKCVGDQASQDGRRSALLACSVWVDGETATRSGYPSLATERMVVPRVATWACLDGQQSVTALVPSTQSFPVGARVRVLIDPPGPGYVEMAGEQFKTNSDAWRDTAAGWGFAAFLRPPT